MSVSSEKGSKVEEIGQKTKMRKKCFWMDNLAPEAISIPEEF
jgi:hypothetical protein